MPKEKTPAGLSPNSIIPYQYPPIPASYQLRLGFRATPGLDERHTNQPPNPPPHAMPQAIGSLGNSAGPVASATWRKEEAMKRHWFLVERHIPGTNPLKIALWG